MKITALNIQLHCSTVQDARIKLVSVNATRGSSTSIILSLIGFFLHKADSQSFLQVGFAVYFTIRCELRGKFQSQIIYSTVVPKTLLFLIPAQV